MGLDRLVSLGVLPDLAEQAVAKFSASFVAGVEGLLASEGESAAGYVNAVLPCMLVGSGSGAIAAGYRHLKAAVDKIEQANLNEYAGYPSPQKSLSDPSKDFVETVDILPRPVEQVVVQPKKKR